MKINRFYLGILTLNIITFNFLFNLINIHPELFSKINIIVIYGVLTLGIIGIIVNYFNAFPKDKILKEINKE